jgi:hypothetical protein
VKTPKTIMKYRRISECGKFYCFDCFGLDPLGPPCRI